MALFGGVGEEEFWENETLVKSPSWKSTVLGSSIAILPLTASGRPDKSAIARVDGHSEMVTDFAFSPFDDGLMVTGSQDQTVKLWRIPEKVLIKKCI